MHSMRDRTPSSRRCAVRLAAGSAALALLAVACGGGDSEDSGGVVAQGEAEEIAAEQAATEQSVGLANAVDLGGTDIDSASEIETNLFPDLVVDDVSRSKKVNLRNLIPSEKPVLLWMYAPH